SYISFSLPQWSVICSSSLTGCDIVIKMSNSSGQYPGQYMTLGERVTVSVLTSGPCAMCLGVNGFMLWTLRSKAVFRDTSRYCLLFNLLVTDTLHMAITQLLYLLAASRTFLHIPVCSLLTLFVDMRYVAVCLPLRHATLVRSRRTAVGIVLLWALCFVNALVRVGLLLDFPFHTLTSLMMSDHCSSLLLRFGPLSTAYDQGYITLLFVVASAAMLWSYVAVMLAACRCVSEKSVKARNTLLLHMFQLLLSLSSTIYMPLLLALARTMARLPFVRLQNTLYVLIFIFPRCLSSLVYGLRDQTIRAALHRALLCKAH
uniref:G-protein coupled receptors family 1 profile domain-containing protein n=1 Tax=Neogobius melanostomus TaxID=47308 RepID=A0A8C6TRA4_9GOBI